MSKCEPPVFDFDFWPVTFDNRLVTLDDFEKNVEPKILARGREYYQDNAIKSVLKLADDEVSAVAYGTSRYNLRLTLKGRTVVKSRCSCPYDWGDNCKHVVALCFYLRQHGTDALNIETMLANAHEAALRRFLTEQIRDDWRLRREFIRAFGPETLDNDEDDEWDDDDDDEDY